MGEMLGKAVEGLSSGLYVPHQARRDALRVVVVAVDHADDEIDRLLEQVARTQLRHPTFKPIFLLTGDPVDALRRLGFQYETVMTEPEWEAVGSGLPYFTYLRQRIEEMRAVYLPQQVVVVPPGATVGPWFPFGPATAGGR